MKHPYQLILLVYIPDLNAISDGFVRDMGVVAFSNSYGHGSGS
ncbi:hypothetical protein CFII64_02266 [Pseudomonas sp. CFII64]|nr:hypothetical protein CFII64_02266 [Pseudomonas sp. CFII64]